jgi:serine/threonine protein kinase/DNA polymerase III delta prime subunit
MIDRVGQHFGNYQLIEALGQGGCAQVYLGKHRYLNSYAALKVLDATIKPRDEHKFLTEAQTLVDLRHPHIVHLRDFGIENGTPVLIMDYAPKGSLRQQYRQGTQMPLLTVVDFVAQIAAALQYAHNHQVIHRDVKPENILLDADNRLLLSDFGLSLLTPSSRQLSTQDPVGTARYMAPEQLQGKPCFASDQYALAVMIYEWLCGVLPFCGNRLEIWQQHLYTAPLPPTTIRPELSPMLEKVVLRALAKKPQDRFVSIQAFAWALARASETAIAVDENASQVTAPMQTLPRLSAVVASHHTAALLPQNNQQAQIPTKTRAKVAPESPPASALQQQNRMRLLQRVRSFWITGVLEQSLHEAALIALGLQEQPDAIANPWRLVIQESEHASPLLPAGTRITDVYDGAHGELLILGEPGAGKTTLLLELARDLLERSEQEQTHPIPIVFNLSSWTRKRQPLATWLIEEMETKYQVPRRVGSGWINADQILPLLDGLDEVDASSRAACMQAINEYHQAHSLVPLVVCSRVNEYIAQSNRLVLSRAVTIQPLTGGQINEYFVRIGEQVTSLRIAFQHDPVLQELAKTPLMLTILILAYQGSSLEEIEGEVSAEERRQQIFATYTQRMLKRRSARSRYSPQQTIHWLSSLARQMEQQSQTVFYIERMQPTWLMKKWQRQLYSGLTTGPVCGLLVGLGFLYTSLSLFPLIAFTTALIVGLLLGWVSKLGEETKGAKRTERGCRRIRQYLAIVLENRVMIGIIVFWAVGISAAFYSYLADYPSQSFGVRIASALGYGWLNSIYIALPLGLAIRLERKIEPVEALSWSWGGIRRNVIRWLLISVGIGLIQGLIFGLPFMTSSQGLWLVAFLSGGLWAMFHLVPVITLVNGVTRGLSKRVLDAQHIVAPNQGTWRSARYGVIMAIISGVIAAAFSGTSVVVAKFWLPHLLGIPKKPNGTEYAIVGAMSHILGFYPTTWQEFWTLNALFGGLKDGVMLGLAAGVYCGGAAYVQHFVLRFLLWGSQYVPFNYPRFLDYATERILLRKVGGGYIFIHRLLLEYFASL